MFGCSITKNQSIRKKEQEDKTTWNSFQTFLLFIRKDERPFFYSSRTVGTEKDSPLLAKLLLSVHFFAGCILNQKGKFGKWKHGSWKIYNATVLTYVFHLQIENVPMTNPTICPNRIIFVENFLCEKIEIKFQNCEEIFKKKREQIFYFVIRRKGGKSFVNQKTSFLLEIKPQRRTFQIV